MSLRKYQRHLNYRPTHSKPTKRLLWIGGLVIVVVIAVVLLGQNRSSSEQVAWPTAVSGAPRVALAQELFDYGTVHYGNVVQTVFKMRNIGDQDLMIKGIPQVEVAEGCCPPRAQLSASTLKPGQEGTITLSFSMHEGMGGKHRYNVHLRTNDPTEPDKELVVLSNWVP